MFIEIYHYSWRLLRRALGLRAGCGKTALVDALAAATGNGGDLVRLQLDDQVDAKSLLGAYVCTAVPGEFVWQPGLLTQARRLELIPTRRCKCAGYICIHSITKRGQVIGQAAGRTINFLTSQSGLRTA